MTSELDPELATLRRASVRHSAMGWLEQLVWERVAFEEDRARQRRVRSSVLILTVAVAFVGGIIVGERESNTRSGALLADDTELLLPASTR